MAKRFIDTAIFRKDFIRGLDAPCKLLFMYLISECDHAGLWDVELEVAEVRLGIKFKNSPLEQFGNKVVSVDGGKKWFIPSFVDFQYGQLNENNRAHGSVIRLLEKFNLLDENNQIKPLTSPLQGRKDMDMDKEAEVSNEKKRTTAKEKSTKVEKTSTETPPDAIEVIEHLNTLTGRKFNPQRQQTAKFVISRLNDGYTSEDLKKIIECKVRKWGDDEKMRQYLRPETLFAPSKVDAYLQDANDTQITKPSQNGKIRDKF